jgi:hypothetical protein
VKSAGVGTPPVPIHFVSCRVVLCCHGILGGFVFLLIPNCILLFLRSFRRNHTRDRFVAGRSPWGTSMPWRCYSLRLAPSCRHCIYCNDWIGLIQRTALIPSWPGFYLCLGNPPAYSTGLNPAGDYFMAKETLTSAFTEICPRLMGSSPSELLPDPLTDGAFWTVFCVHRFELRPDPYHQPL